MRKQIIAAVLLLLGTCSSLSAQIPTSTVVIYSNTLEDFQFDSGGGMNMRVYAVDVLFSFNPATSHITIESKDSFGNSYTSVFSTDRAKTQDLVASAQDDPVMQYLRVIVGRSKKTGQEYMFVIDQIGCIVSVQSCYDPEIGRYANEQIYSYSTSKE
jgi:hypothetical protein